MTTNTSKQKALRKAAEYSIPIYNVELKTASDIFNEIAEHQLQMHQLDKLTIFAVQGIARTYLLNQAKQFKIPYTEDSLNSGQLRDEINYWQSLLIRAKELNIEWDQSDYSPLYLRQAIEEAETDGFREKESLRSFYYASIRL